MKLRSPVAGAVLAGLSCLYACANDQDAALPPPAAPAGETAPRVVAMPRAVATRRAQPLDLSGTLLSALPEETLFAVHLPDIGRCREQLQTTVYGDLCADPTAAVRKLGGLSRMGMPVRELEDLVVAMRGEAMIALLGVEDDRPRLLLGVSMSGQGDAATRLAKRFVDWMTDGRDDLSSEKNGIWTVHDDFTDAIEEVGVRDDRLWFGVGEGTVGSAMERHGRSVSLSAAERRSFGPNDLLRLRVDIGAFGEMLSKVEPGAEPPANLHLDAISGFALGVSVEKGEFVLEGYLDSPGGRDVVTRYFAEHPVNRELLSRVPAEANAFSLFALDVAWILDQMPGEALNDVPRKDRSLIRDVLGSLGSTWMHVGVPSRDPDGVYPLLDDLMNTVFLVELQDEEVVDRVLAAIGPRRRPPQEPFRAAGATGFSVPLPGGMPVPGLRPTFIVKDRVLYAGVTPDAVRRVLEGTSAEGTARFERALATVPGNASMIAYDTMVAGMGLLSMLQTAGNGPAHFDDSVMANLRELERAVSRMPPAVSYLAADRNGVMVHTRSALGFVGGLTSGVSIPVIASIAIPNFMSARLNANESAAIASLRNLTSAQAQCQMSGMLDRNANGVGEFAFFTELVEPPGGDLPLLSPAWRPLDGLALRSGYHYRIYLPGENGEFVAEGDPLPTDRLGTANSELVWCAYAWPAEPGATGRRSFFVDQAGDLYQCFHTGYGGANGPPPDIHYREPNDMRAEPLPVGEAARDGSVWVPVD